LCLEKRESPAEAGDLHLFLFRFAAVTAGGATARARAGAALAIGATDAFLTAFFSFYYVRHRAAYNEHQNSYYYNIFHNF
jgi:hypothetical protein